MTKGTFRSRRNDWIGVVGTGIATKHHTKVPTAVSKMLSPFTKILVKSESSLKHLEQVTARGRLQGPTLNGLVEHICIKEHALKDHDVGNVPIGNWLVKSSRIRKHELKGGHRACVPIVYSILAAIVESVPVPEHPSHIGNGGSIPRGKVLIKGEALVEHVHNGSARTGNCKYGGVEDSSFTEHVSHGCDRSHIPTTQILIEGGC